MINFFPSVESRLILRGAKNHPVIETIATLSKNILNGPELDKLPSELLFFMLTRNLGYKERLALCLTNKNFYNLFKQAPTLAWILEKDSKKAETFLDSKSKLKIPLDVKLRLAKRAGDFMTHLDVQKTSFSDALLKTLCDTCRNIKHLNLSFCPNISAAGIKYISSLYYLESLDLTGDHKIPAEGFICLGSLPSLKYLALGNCSINDNSLKALQSLSLESLNLSCCHSLSDQWMETLSSLTSLRHLNLSGLPITDKCLDKLKSLPFLREVNLNFCNGITLEAKKAFHEFLKKKRQH